MSSAGPAISDEEKTAKSDQLLHQICEIQSKLLEDKNSNDNIEEKPEDNENTKEKIEKIDDKKDETENSSEKSSKNKNSNDNIDEKIEDNENTEEKVEKTDDKKSETEESNDENEKSIKDKDLDDIIDEKSKDNENTNEKVENTDDKKDEPANLNDEDEKSSITKDVNLDNDNETNESNKRDIDSYQTTDGFISNTESNANSDSSHPASESFDEDKNHEDPKENHSDNDSKDTANQNILQQTNTIINAIIDGVQSENNDDEVTKDRDNTLENDTEDQNKKETENTLENDNQTDALPHASQDSNTDDNLNKNDSSHPLTNIFSSTAEKLQVDTVQITDATSQTDPVPISVSCQTSFPPSELESEIEAEANADANTNSNINANTNTSNREYQMQDIFASFNCRCTQTRKLDKTLSRSSELGSRSSHLYSRPRKTAQATKSKQVNRKNNNALLHLEISQPISPIQFRSSANSALSSNVGSPRSSAASTLSSSAEERSKNNYKKDKNILPNINSKSSSSSTERARTSHSGYASTSSHGPTKTPNIKTGQLSATKKGTSSNSKSCALKRNINGYSNPKKTVLQPSKNTKKATKEEILKDSVQEIVNDLTNDQLSSEKAQTLSENSLQDEKVNSTQIKKKSAEPKPKKNNLDEQLTALTANLIPGSLTTNKSNTKSKLTQKSYTSNSIQIPQTRLNSMSKAPESTSATASTKSLGGTSQDNKMLSSLSSSSYKDVNKVEIEEEEETSVDDSEAPHIVKKRDYQGNTTEVNFTDNDSSSVQHKSDNNDDDFKPEEEEEDKSQSDEVGGEKEVDSNASDEVSYSPDFEQMIDDILNNNLPSNDDDITSLFSYIKRRELDCIMSEDYENCDRLHRASSILVNSRSRARFISEHYNAIDNRLAKAESDLDSMQQLHKERLERFDYERDRMKQDLDKRQKMEVDDFESFWSSSRALVPFDKASSGLLDLRFKQKQSALIKEFSTAQSMKKIADSIQVVEEDGAALSAESSMKIAYSQLIDKHNGQKAAFEQKMSRNRNFLNAEAEFEIERQKLLIQQLEAKKEEKYDARARNNALSEMGFLSETVSPRTFESFTNYRKDPTASKLRLNSTSIVQTLHPKKQTKRPFTPGKTKRYGGYC